MIFKLFIFLLPLSLFATEVVWNGVVNGGISQVEYDRVIKEYVGKKYPKRVEAWQEKQKEIQRQKKIQRQKEIQNSTVSLNGLMWQDNKDAKTKKRDRKGAKEYCRDLELLGFTDWYLPNREELKSIVDRKRKPSIKKEFKYCASSRYWSSSPDVSRSEYAWGVDFKFGYSYNDRKTYEYYVRCARAGQ